MADSIYRTVYHVEVFSRGPFEVSDEGAVLEEISYAITEGDCIGDISEVSSEVVAPERVRSELVRIGNTGGFFDLFDPEAFDELEVAGGGT